MGEVAFVGYDEGVEFYGRFPSEICGFGKDRGRMDTGEEDVAVHRFSSNGFACWIQVLMRKFELLVAVLGMRARKRILSVLGDTRIGHERFRS